MNAPYRARFVGANAQGSDESRLAPYRFKYEVLAIEESGNQTLSSAEFTTR